MTSNGGTIGRLTFVGQMTLLALGVIVFPLMVAALFNAASEAFLGEKEPVLQTGLGLFVGGALAGGIALGVFAIGRNGWKWTAWALIVALLAFDASVIPLARWMIRTAAASPTGRIEW